MFSEHLTIENIRSFVNISLNNRSLFHLYIASIPQYYKNLARLLEHSVNTIYLILLILSARSNIMFSMALSRFFISSLSVSVFFLQHIQHSRVLSYYVTLTAIVSFTSKFCNITSLTYNTSMYDITSYYLFCEMDKK